MAIRTPESILCGHCAAVPGVRDCPGCGLTVCEPCSKKRTGCAKPRAIEIRLGLGSRLRAIDPTCRWGLAMTWNDKGFRVDFDERSYTRALTEWGHSSVGPSGAIVPRRVRDREHLIEVEPFSDGWVKLRAESLAALAPIGRSFEPFRRKSISAVACDRERVACGAFNEVGVWRLDDLERITRIKFDGHDVSGIRIAGEVVAALLETGSYFNRPSYELVVWRIDGGEELFRLELGRARVPLLDLSGDGAIAVAATESSETAVLEIGETTSATRLGGHSDGLSALRLSTAGDRLVSGDHDNRVIVRDRGSGGFPDRVEPAELTRV